jgi:hypothetical protein
MPALVSSADIPSGWMRWRGREHQVFSGTTSGRLVHIGWPAISLEVAENGDIVAEGHYLAGAIFGRARIAASAVGMVAVARKRGARRSGSEQLAVMLKEGDVCLFGLSAARSTDFLTRYAMLGGTTSFHVWSWERKSGRIEIRE